MIVTDAVSALGLQQGTHTIGQMVVEIKGSKALIAGTNTLCGSITSMCDSVKYFKSATGKNCVEFWKLMILAFQVLQSFLIHHMTKTVVYENRFILFL